MSKPTRSEVVDFISKTVGINPDELKEEALVGRNRLPSICSAKFGVKVNRSNVDEFTFGQLIDQILGVSPFADPPRFWSFGKY